MRRQPFGPDEWDHLTRTALGFSSRKYALLGADERARLVARKLWDGDNLAQFEEEEREARKRKHPGKVKRELRERKKGGGGYRDVLEYNEGGYGLVFEQ